MVRNCPGCRRPPTSGRIVEALGRQWHIECLTCTKCHNFLDPADVKEKFDLPYCENCFDGGGQWAVPAPRKKAASSIAPTTPLLRVGTVTSAVPAAAVASGPGYVASDVGLQRSFRKGFANASSGGSAMAAEYRATLSYSGVEARIPRLQSQQPTMASSSRPTTPVPSASRSSISQAVVPPGTPGPPAGTSASFTPSAAGMAYRQTRSYSEPRTRVYPGGFPMSSPHYNVTHEAFIASNGGMFPAKPFSAADTLSSDDNFEESFSSVHSRTSAADVTLSAPGYLRSQSARHAPAAGWAATVPEHAAAEVVAEAVATVTSSAGPRIIARPPDPVVRAVSYVAAGGGVIGGPRGVDVNGIPGYDESFSLSNGSLRAYWAPGRFGPASPVTAVPPPFR